MLLIKSYLIALLLKLSVDYVSFQGLHPRILTEGFDKAKTKTLEILDKMKVKIEPTRENLLDIARTSLRTKVHVQLADVLTDVSNYTMYYYQVYCLLAGPWTYGRYVFLSYV